MHSSSLVFIANSGAFWFARRAALVSLLGLSACKWGTTPAKVLPLLSAKGVEVAIALPVQTWPLRGELFAVDSMGVMVKSDVLTHVKWTTMKWMDVVGFGKGFDLSSRERMTSEHLEQLRVLSRFPQGLNGPLLAQVLQSLRQDSVMVFVPMSPPE